MVLLQHYLYNLDNLGECLIVRGTETSCGVPTFDGCETIAGSSVVAAVFDILESAWVLVNERVEETHRRFSSLESKAVEEGEDTRRNRARCTGSSNTCEATTNVHAVWSFGTTQGSDIWVTTAGPIPVGLRRKLRIWVLKVLLNCASLVGWNSEGVGKSTATIVPGLFRTDTRSVEVCATNRGDVWRGSREVRLERFLGEPAPTAFSATYTLVTRGEKDRASHGPSFHESRVATVHVLLRRLLLLIVTIGNRVHQWHGVIAGDLVGPVQKRVLAVVDDRERDLRCNSSDVLNIKLRLYTGGRDVAPDNFVDRDVTFAT
mmetsp:Transcript_20464/g.50222  ORF Transcript_20464/g.50222 Transcript_20464/m.50222 type:complete len:318 (-) Transcript_20464:819-1772(-)